MRVFFGKIVKYFLWSCFFALLSAFVFGLIKFKGNFVDYILFLDSVGVEKILKFDFYDQEKNLEDNINIESEFEKILLEEQELQKEESVLDKENLDNSFGFSGTLDSEGSVEDGSTSVSKDALVDLIKSREK